MSWLELRDRVIVVTGATGGIGRAMVSAFSGQGARVVLLDIDRAGTESAAAELGGVLALTCDMGDPEAVASAAGQVERELGGADVLVNNAAILRPGALEHLAVADWEAMLRINLTGYLLASQEFGRAMLERGEGAIVHVASIAGTQPQPQSGAYSPSKAATLMLSRQLAQEWGPRGVRSNTVSPGLVMTPMSAAFYADAEVKSRREEMVPLRRIAGPEDMADVALFLASRRASYVSGQDIVVDGGLSQSLMGFVPRPGYA
ncbi:SDR family NAD(P)-dependent oxidoreductase [Haematobacter missouriensis]|uniref:2-deoxy-D-gluconate 3-dehydrogenase n=1 Tax=Haematobacter missouriensis TaxID=366616 RepID=A0A212AI93_9RHOB|nr:SDR family oxidoreductase [Haematobacter missouriensis]OWJ81135.1 2-deoxy-D-gluconate 3-dehydrogenase [Haematobacter missouriensis]